jgi:teichuronic acid biosynthesis glycosyltransferase TuaG
MNIKTPFFSIIIPCYNSSKTIIKTLDSVFNQTFKNFEIIVINDGSIDNTLDLLISYDKLSINIINQDNKGLGESRNIGIEKSKGEYISFLDSDDLWTNDKLEVVHDSILKTKADLICHYEQLSLNNERIGILKHGPHTKYLDILLKGNCLSPSAVCVKKDILIKVGMFSTDIKCHGTEDWDLWLKISKFGANIVYINRVLGFYILYPNDVNMSSLPDFYKKGKYVFESHVSSIKNPSFILKHRINGARAINEIYGFISNFKNFKYKETIFNLFTIFKFGILNYFFWVQIFNKSFNYTKRILNS